MVVLMKLQKWQDMEVSSKPQFPYPIKFDAPDSQVGYLEVYESREALLKVWPETDPALMLEIEFSHVTKKKKENKAKWRSTN